MLFCSHKHPAKTRLCCSQTPTTLNPLYYICSINHTHLNYTCTSILHQLGLHQNTRWTTKSDWGATPQKVDCLPGNKTKSTWSQRWVEMHRKANNTNPSSTTLVSTWERWTIITYKHFCTVLYWTVLYVQSRTPSTLHTTATTTLQATWTSKTSISPYNNNI